MTGDEIANNMYLLLEKTAKPHQISPEEKTVWDIIKGTEVTLKDVELANPGKNLNKIKAGDIINIPDSEELKRIRSKPRVPVQRGKFNLDKTISSAAGRYKIDPILLKAILRIESGGKSSADSGHAQGLGQLTPYAQKIVGVTDPFDPTQNIYGAAHWLALSFEEAKKLKDIDQSKIQWYALLIYHAGAPNVQAWVSAGHPAEGLNDMQLSSITYPDRVLSNM